MEQLVKSLLKGDFRNSFEQAYPLGAQLQPSRYAAMIEHYVSIFGEPESLRLFSSPGRTELGGNHTDHQRGCIIAAAVPMDIIAVVNADASNRICLSSEGYGTVEVMISDLEKQSCEENTTASLVRGICARMVELGYTIGGFSAVVQSSVPAGSGLSSSAAFENLITTILNDCYNGGRIDPVTVAKIGQYAENCYFGKPSGLMDQAASAVGGVITVDFANNDNPKVEFLSLNLADYGYVLCIINTHSDHADLTGDYAEIFQENREIAQCFGAEALREVDFLQFYEQIPMLRKQFGDRAVLRALHFFEENARVADQVAAIRSGNFESYRRMVLESGESSLAQLQNVYSVHHPAEQSLNLALQISRRILAPVGGAWRVHGGGFAGTVQAYVPNAVLPEYQREMNRIFGSDATQVLAIRPVGSVEIVPDLG